MQIAETKVPLNIIGNILMDSGFKRMAPYPMIGGNNKPTFRKNNAEVIVCIPCGWIRHNGKMYRAQEVTSSLIDKIISDANS